MSGLIDPHCHLLPGVDDGCKTVEESIVCARGLVAAGYSDVVCTPHIWPNLPENNPEVIVQKVAALQVAMDAAGVGLRLHAGGEINLQFTIMEENPQTIVSYRMAQRHVLFDMWVDRIPPWFDEAVEFLQSMGLSCILAHPERMSAVQSDPQLADRFAEAGILLQGNLQCFSDPENLATRRLADRYLGEGRYFMLGSDTHDPGSLASRMEGLERLRGQLPAADFLRLTRDNPRTLLED